MNAVYIILKITMFVLIAMFSADALLRTVSYSMYKGDRQLRSTAYTPAEVQLGENLWGYGCNLDLRCGRVVLFFGGSGNTAYNCAGMYGGIFDCPFLAADYHGTQKSAGRMNLKTMQQTAVELYDYARVEYPDSDIYVMGHSYGCGMAAYLAGARDCSRLVLVSAYRTNADLYNGIIPVFHGPLQVFIKDNIRIDRYAQTTACPVTIIGSDADRTLGADIQRSLADCYTDAQLKIFSGIDHGDYLLTEEVVEYIRQEAMGLSPSGKAEALSAG